MPATAKNKAFELELELCYEETMIGAISTMNPYERHMNSYLALCVEQKLHQNIKLHKYNCTDCGNVLSTSNEKMDDEFLAMKGPFQPSASTFKIVIFANAVMNMYSAERHQGNSFNEILQTINQNLDIDDLFTDFYLFAHDGQETPSKSNHKEEFISELIKIYMLMKSKSVCKKVTDRERGQLIRYKKKHAYLAAGQ